MEKLLYYGVLKGVPRTKKNSSQIVQPKGMKRPMVIQSANYRQYEKDCLLQLKPIKEPISVPINLKIHVYKKDKRKSDLSNYIESIQDILVKRKILLDDNYTIVESLDGSRVFVDKDNPRVEFWIYEIEKNTLF